MKSFIVMIAVVAVSLVGAHAAYAQAYYPGHCLHDNSKACQDARKAFAEHHNGITVQEWYNEHYQGQQGRWVWDNADGDDWYEGRQGHWFQEPEGWRYRSDDGDQYMKGKKGWGWLRSWGDEGRDRDHDRDHEHDHDRDRH